MADAESAKGAVKDILDSRREFTIETPDREILHFFIASPTGEDIRKADWQYSKVYNQAIVDGLLTQSQMLELLRTKGILSTEYSQKLEGVRITLGAELFRLENLLEKATEEEKEVCALEVARLRDELFQLNQRINGPMANTCENLAEDARTDFLTSRLVEKKDRTKFWKDYDAYRNEENTALAIKARFEVMLWMQGLESNFLENTPEQSVLRQIQQSRIEKATTAAREVITEATPLAAEEAPVVENVVLPDEPTPPPAPPKKRGRPRKDK
jgi:hypothetical protein